MQTLEAPQQPPRVATRSRYFDPRGKLSYKEKITIELVGAALLLGAWQAVYELAIFSRGIVPSISSVVSAIVALAVSTSLWKDVGYSLLLNILGLAEAAVICLPLGIFLGLFPGPRAMSERIIASARYVPMTAATGVFMGLFGIYFNMKLQFLAASIILFLLPQVVYHIDQVPQVWVDTMRTLGAKRHQIVWRLFIPAIMPDFIFSVINLSAISWTYIVVAETINGQYGIGQVAWMAGRQGRMDTFYAAILLIVIIGFAIDKLGSFAIRLKFGYRFKKKGE